MVTVKDSVTDRAQVLEHELAAAPGHVQHDQVWKCKYCGKERVHLEDFETTVCDGGDPENA